MRIVPPKEPTNESYFKSPLPLRHYHFDLMSRSYAAAHGVDADDRVNERAVHTYVRVTVEAYSDVDALGFLRSEYPECAWRLVGLNSVNLA